MDHAARRDRLLARFHRRRGCLWVPAWTYHIVGWLLIAAMVAGFAGAVLYNWSIHRR
jgi:hypothetical protein